MVVKGESLMVLQKVAVEVSMHLLVNVCNALNLAYI